jgi:hypothetical protein
MSQCQSLTKQGKQCSRKATKKSQTYCAQHTIFNIPMPYVEDTQPPKSSEPVSEPQLNFDTVALNRCMIYDFKECYAWVDSTQLRQPHANWTHDVTMLLAWIQTETQVIVNRAYPDKHCAILVFNNPAERESAIKLMPLIWKQSPIKLTALTPAEYNAKRCPPGLFGFACPFIWKILPHMYQNDNGQGYARKHKIDIHKY